VSTQPSQQSHEEITCVTEQMSFNKGMAMFGEEEATSVIVELRQLDYWKAIEPADASQMSCAQ